MSPTPTFVSRNRYCRHLLGFADIFHAAGLDAPANGDLLGEDLLRQIERMPYRHLALEAAQTLVRLELGRIGSRNRALTRLFSDLVRSIQLEQLLELARELRIASRERGAALGLREDELAYYDVIDVDGSIDRDLGTERAKAITREIVSIVQSQDPYDWRLRESGRRELRMKIRAVLESILETEFSFEIRCISVIASEERLPGGGDEEGIDTGDGTADVEQ